MISKTSKFCSLSPVMKRLYEKLHFVSDLGCGMATGNWPLINILKTADGAVVEALMPGIELSELKLSLRKKFFILDRGMPPCTVRKQEQEFFRSIEFPFAIDSERSAVHTYNGILRVHLYRRNGAESNPEETDGEAHEEAHAIRVLTGTEEISPKLVPILSKSANRAEEKPSVGMVIPKTEIVETESSYLMVVELPGIPSHAIDITLDGSIMTIQAMKPFFLFQENTQVYSEFELLSYRRRISLFEDMDGSRIVALLKNGTLRMRVPKKPTAK